MNATPVMISPEEQEQLQQTVEMFEVIVQASPQDCQSMEILKDAYVTNRLSDKQAARLLDRSDVIQAVGSDMIESERGNPAV